MRGREKQQQDFLSHAIYEARIPKNHFLRRLLKLVDWRALAAELNDCYRHRGRPSVPPEMMLKIMILQYLYNLSDRQMEEQLRYNLSFMFFVGIAPDEEGPDHSTISRFRARVGAAAAGQPRLGRKSKREGFYGYKHHMAVDADSGMIVGSAVTPGNESDGALMAEVLDGRAEAVVADKAYDTPSCHRLLESRKIENRIIRRKGGNGSRRSQRYVVERVNGVVKRWCGGGRARYWGLEKVTIQMLLASMAANLKR